MNAGYLVDAIGLWAETRIETPVDSAPILFLDRDGVIIEDTGYVGDPLRARIYPDAPTAIARARAGGFRIVLVTNQSGIGRGMYGWDSFAAIQQKIDAALTAAHATIDAVFACAYHEEAVAPYDIGDHAWRKPQPGMILEGLRLLNGLAAPSALVGDRGSDIAAARAAGLGRAVLIGRDTKETSTASPDAVVSSLGEAVSFLLSLQELSPAHRHKVASPNAAADRD